MQYKGQAQEIPVKFKEILGGRQIYDLKAYNEIVDGKKNGEYRFEFDYSEATTGVEITYTRNDGKEFYFESLDLEWEIEDKVFSEKINVFNN